MNMPKMPVALVTSLPEKIQHPLRFFFLTFFLKNSFCVGCEEAAPTGAVLGQHICVEKAKGEIGAHSL